LLFYFIGVLVFFVFIHEHAILKNDKPDESVSFALQTEAAHASGTSPGAASATVTWSNSSRMAPWKK
jgi:hypothetical protein